MATEVTTTDSQEYKFYPLNFGALHFSVKASNDAHIALTATAENKPPKYEIFLGGWGNSKSSIRKNNEEPDKVIADTPKILNGSEERSFWIKWGGGFIGVGKQGEEKPFMSWQDEESLNVSFYGVRTGWGATGVWTIEAPPAASPGWKLDGPTSGPVQWVHASNGQIPPNALPGGFDATNEQLYVARAEHNGALIPGKLVPSHGVVYVAWGGVENPKENYEVLCNCSGTWVKANQGEIPVGALSSGHTEDGEPLFIGRGQHDGSVTVGKVNQKEIKTQKSETIDKNCLLFDSGDKSSMNSLIMTLLKSSLEKENDDHDVFGAYVAMEIRNLKSSDLQTKLRAKIRDSISQIVNEDSMIKNELTGSA
uniref:C3 and PZP-like alpha-2-macroglobulin domain-containing protein 8 n=1 Tax=Sipha flava TaxID=143950 RepID=A0A2S2Q4X7_9HEMI